MMDFALKLMNFSGMNVKGWRMMGGSRQMTEICAKYDLCCSCKNVDYVLKLIDSLCAKTDRFLYAKNDEV